MTWIEKQMMIKWNSMTWVWKHFDGLVHERRNSSALAMELRLSCTDPLILEWCTTFISGHHRPIGIAAVACICLFICLSILIGVILFKDFTLYSQIWWSSALQHIETWTQWLTFCRQSFQIYFIKWKCVGFREISLKSVPKGPINNDPTLV